MKLTRKLIALILAIATLLTLASCGATSGPPVEGEKATVVIDLGDDNYQVFEVKIADLTDKSQGAYSLLVYLKENRDMHLDIVESSYGAYVNSIGDLRPDASKNEYIAIYTSVEADFQVPTADFPDVPSLTYHEVLLKSSGVGISSMTVQDRTVILFRIESW